MCVAVTFTVRSSPTSERATATAEDEAEGEEGEEEEAGDGGVAAELSSAA